MCPQQSYYKAFISHKIFCSNTGAFHKNSLSVACCTFSMLEVGTLTPNRFKNQSSDTLNRLGHNCNHQQEFVKQRTVALHHFGFKLKFPKHWLRLLFWVKFINVTVVTPYWDSNGWNVYVSTVVLLSTFLTTKKLALSISVGFHKNSLIVACLHSVSSNTEF